MIKRIFIIITVFAIVSQGRAQTKFELNGLGRAILSNEQLSGNITEDDSLSPISGSGGYTLFDLGMTIDKQDKFHALTILRVRNEFGLFYGAGAAFSFRQITLGGKINDQISYEAGDIDIEMTPFTVSNNAVHFRDYESDLFAQRTTIQQYENFVNGNNWRLQGIKFVNNHELKEGLGIKGQYAIVRTNATNDLNVADRVFTANQLHVGNEKWNAGINHTGFLDVGIATYDVKFNNQVITFDGKYQLTEGKLPLALKAKGGFSDYKYADNLGDTTVENSDFFYVIAAKASPKFFDHIRVGYQDVGPQFVSPGAQTRRINTGASPLLFNKVNNASVDRSMGYYDRLTDENTYNRSLNITLQDFIPAYSNALPYGKATPNRRGVNFGVATDTSIKFLDVTLNGALLSEITPDRVQDGELRQFMHLQGGVNLNIEELLDWKRQLNFRAGIHTENTSRSGVGVVDLGMSSVDVGASAEVLNNIHIIAGLKTLSASGNEYLSQRDQFNGLVEENPTALDYQFSETILATGVLVDISSLSQFSATYFKSQMDDQLNEASSYNIGQLFFNYTIKF